MTTRYNRRQFVGQSAVLGISAAAASALATRRIWASSIDERLIAKAPAGFSPFTAPGKVVQVTKGNDFPSLMQPNQLWPKPEVAKQMLERLHTELTGAPDLVSAMMKFVHNDDIVAVKINGIVGQKVATMAVNYELIAPVVEAIVGAGVPA